MKCVTFIALLPNVLLAQSTALEQFARQRLQETNAVGFVHVRDVKTGRVLVHENTAPDLAMHSSVAPLSVIKVYLAASWLEHGFGDYAVDCDGSASRPVRHMRVEDVLMSSCDSAGKRMAILLRRRIGAAAVLSDLRRYGIRDLTLRPDASDDEWGRVLSLGEQQVPATPAQISGFFAAIATGGGKLLSAHTAERLESGLEATVERGTATAIKDSLAGTGWKIGGRTGTGPGECGDHCDGWFASLVSDRRRGRYVVLAFIRARGLGSGVAAHTAAAVAEYLATHDADKK